MSRAGKFIPGGGSGKTPAGRTGPIRAPDPAAPPPDPNAPPAKKPFKGLVKPVQKSQRMPIVIMSAVVCIILVSVGWYTLAYLPAIRDRDNAKKANELLQQQLQAEHDAAVKAEEARIKAAASVRSSLIVDTNPTGATVIIGDFKKTTPATFTDMVPGPVSLVIKLDGYEDLKQDATISADKDKPTDLGVITLVQKTGAVSITSPQSNVTYTLTGPGGYSHGGPVPDKVEALPIGDYVLTVSQKDWQLPSVPVTIKDHDNLTKDIKFPYANVTINSSPSGATVRDGRTVLGVTPVTLSQIRPKDLHVSVDLPPYTLQRVDIHVPDFGNVNKMVTLKQDKDFITSSGMPMVWIADGGFWVGKYLVRQSDMTAVGANDPSTFRRPTRPVETISWNNATAFCDQLTELEKKAGKLPAGFHFALPKEAQWEVFSADANIDMAATSRNTTLPATQDVGYSEPNKYGIYDSIGNVWEWMADNFDANGNHSLRGGCWLSSVEHFPNAEVRQAGGPKYADQFTGFRVVLVPDK